MNAKVLKWTGIFVFLAVFGLLSQPMPVNAANSSQTSQVSCHALSESYANVAHPEDSVWVECFLAGWVNWVFGTDEPLPANPPAAVEEAFKHGAYVQLTEPWNGGCDDTLRHPDCSIGFLRLFGDWSSLRAFLAAGSFTQAGVIKDGPWAMGSLWMTANYVHVESGDSMTSLERELFCGGDIAWAFATDGEYPLPASDPCGGSNDYYLREAWVGSCIGDLLPNSACNVGEVIIFESWTEMLSFLNEGGWTRGSVFANTTDLVAMPEIEVGSTSGSTPGNVTTQQDSPGNLQGEGREEVYRIAFFSTPFTRQVTGWFTGWFALVGGLMVVFLIVMILAAAYPTVVFWRIKWYWGLLAGLIAFGVVSTLSWLGILLVILITYGYQKGWFQKIGFAPTAQ